MIRFLTKKSRHRRGCRSYDRADAAGFHQVERPATEAGRPERSQMTAGLQIASALRVAFLLKLTQIFDEAGAAARFTPRYRYICRAG